MRKTGHISGVLLTMVILVCCGIFFAAGTCHAVATNFKSIAGSLATARNYHTATLLSNGKVLITGGKDSGGNYLASAELYNPATGTFTTTGNMTATRGVHTATLLPNGKVLIAGGESGSGNRSSAELYDPATGTFIATNSMATTRGGHIATLLPNGKVLVIGGSSSTSAELYNPATSTFTAAGNMTTARWSCTATLLPNGKVLISGGILSLVARSSAELYDPNAGTFTATGSMITARSQHTSTLLSNGKVLITGGYDFGYIATAELYNPATGTFTATASLTTARNDHAATLLPNGKVLIAGGWGASGDISSAELYDPNAGTFTTDTMSTARAHFTTTLLPDGQVFIAAGQGPISILASAERYDYAAGTFTATGSMAAARTLHTATLLPDGTVQVAGGQSLTTGVQGYSAAVFTSNINSLITARYSHTATLLPNGKVLYVGGQGSSSKLTSSELYNPTNGQFSATGSLATGRSQHTAALLPNGKVLIAGGEGSSRLASAELYDPAGNNGVGSFTATGSMTTQRSGHASTLLPNGKVIITGGWGVNSAELYDPAGNNSIGSFTVSGNMTATERIYHTATLLPNGKVLVTGGMTAGGGALASAELYNPATGTFTATGSMITARRQHTAVLLPNGKVLITGGWNSISGELASMELYDPSTGLFTATSSLTTARKNHTAALLPNGQVLITGGERFGSALTSSQLYNQGLGFSDAARPVISTISTASRLSLTGTGFTAISEGSSGSTYSSATNYPLIHLRRIDNAQTIFTLTDPTVNWSATAVASSYSALTGLPTGHYLATVYANGLPSQSKIIVLTVPDAPTIGTATGGNAQATITFTAPANNGGRPISGYTVTSSPAGGTDSNAGTTGLSHVVTGLTNGTAYTFSVTATNESGTSAPSASVGATPKTVPGAPTIISAVAGNGQASLAFKPPASNGGSVITMYTVSGGGTDSSAGTNTTTRVITGLTNGVTYTFTVTATNAVGTSAPSDPAPVTPLTVPGVPTGISAVPGNSLVMVYFTAPASNGGTITSYTITSNTGVTASGTTSPITRSGLSNGTSYTFTVTATNAAGTGGISAASGAVIPRTTPGAPAIVSAVAGNAQATISFTAPASNGGSAITGYTVTSNPGNLSASGAASPITVTGLTNGTSYTFTVSATNIAGAGAPATSGSVTPVTLPGAPTGVSAVAGFAQATVTFTPPLLNGGSAITGYTVTSSPAGGTDSSAGNTGLSHVIIGLTNNTTYTFTVRATSAVGVGAASTVSNSVTPTVVFTPATKAHLYHTATLLSNGKVLIAGGKNDTNGTYLTNAELYDPATGMFTPTGIINTPRIKHTATLLPNGKVLIAGGQDAGGTSLTSAELYDPATGTFTATTTGMNDSRNCHTATLLRNGKVFIAGGSLYDFSSELNSAELYNPADDSFTAIIMNNTRSRHAATLLPSGKVLLSGGYSSFQYLKSAELYDPNNGINGTFTTIDNMSTERSKHTTTLLPNGKVLITGGYGSTFLSSAELYDPAAGSNGTFTAIIGANGSLSAARESHTATLLPNGTVLFAGGGGISGYLASMELFNPATNTFATTTNMSVGREFHTATLLPNGQVLISGGDYNTGTLASAELYTPATATFTSNFTNANVIPMTGTRNNYTATTLPNGKVLIAGGYSSSSGYLATAELYDPSNGTFTSTGSMNFSRGRHTATLLPNGKVLVTGGEYSSGYRNSTELFDPNAGVNGTFTTIGNMSMARAKHTATLLSSGKVLIAGGVNPSPQSSAELYDPYAGATGTFTAAGNMQVARNNNTATLLPNGKVLFVGGWSSVFLTSAELYDPSNGTFTYTGSLTAARESHTATLLPNGKVLVTGGWNGSSALASSELYYQSAGSNGAFTPIGNMTISRKFHTATLLPNGRVLIAGGDVASAQLYEPLTDTFIATVSLITARTEHTATLLPNGKVLIAGGVNGIGLASAELYDQGLGYSDSSRPVVNASDTSSGLSLTGTGFTGLNGALPRNEGSSGTGNSSATNYPLVQLRHIDSEQTRFILTDPAVDWAATSVSSVPVALAGMPSGYYLATVYANGIPSVSSPIMLAVPGAPSISAAVGGNAEATVTFSAPGFVGSSVISSYTVTSNPGNVTASGTTSPITVTGLANGTFYTFTVTATNSFGTGPASGISSSVQPQKSDQTITFNPLADHNFGTTPTLTLTDCFTSSLLPVSFTSTTPAVCTITSNGALTFVTAGTCSINADQAGNAFINAAPSVSRSFNVIAVAPGAPGIGSATAGNGQATVTFSAPGFNGGSAIDSYIVTSNPDNITASGTTANPITVTGLTNGTTYNFTVQASNIAGAGSASAASNYVTPQGTAQIITFNQPAAQNFGATPTLAASSNSTLPVSFTSATPFVCTITSGGLLAFVTPGTCTISADQAGNASYNPAPQVSRSFAINAVAPGVPTVGTPIAGNGLVTVPFTPPASDGGSAITGYTVVSTPAGGTDINAGSTVSPHVLTGLTNEIAYTFTVKATNAVGSGSASASSSAATPQKAGQTITYDPPGDQSFWTPRTPAAYASSGLPLSFTSSTTAVCTITSSGVMTYLTTGTCTINAAQAGNAGFTAATPVSQSFAVIVVADSLAPTTTASSVGGSYTTTQNVTLTCSDDISGCATTYYCVSNGCTPNLIYSSPISISTSQTLTFASIDAAGNLETAKSETYTITIIDNANDGQPDIYWFNSATGESSVWYMNGEIVKSIEMFPTAPKGWNVVKHIDYNKDGKMDIIWHNPTTGQSGVWYMNGATRDSVEMFPTAPIGWQIADIIDFDKNGTFDLIWFKPSTGESAVWSMNGANRSKTDLFPTAPLGWNIIGVKDYNTDGNLDLLWFKPTTGESGVWYMIGASRDSVGLFPRAPVGWQIVDVVDYDKNGTYDLIWFKPSTGESGVWYMNGANRSSLELFPSAPIGWNLIGVTDYSGDGKLDLLWFKPTTGVSGAWYMTGATRDNAVFFQNSPIGWKITTINTNLVPN